MASGGSLSAHTGRLTAGRSHRRRRDVGHTGSCRRLVNLANRLAKMRAIAHQVDRSLDKEPFSGWCSRTK